MAKIKNNDVYKITIINWEKHNPNRKKNYKYTQISNNLIHDSKLRVLPVSVRWLWINLLLTAGDHSRDTVEISERQLRDMLESSWSVARALNAFQSFQMVSYEILPSLYNRIELNRIEENRIEIPGTSKKIKKVASKELNLKIWDAYKTAYFSRYQTEPVRNASVNSKISQLAARLGEDGIHVASFYLNHNDSFYIKNLHNVGLLLSHAEQLHTQWKRDFAVTGSRVKELEKSLHVDEQFAFIEKYGI